MIPRATQAQGKTCNHTCLMTGSNKHCTAMFGCKAHTKLNCRSILRSPTSGNPYRRSFAAPSRDTRYACEQRVACGRDGAETFTRCGLNAKC